MSYLGVLFLVFCGQLQAQHTLVVNDANGKLVGIPVSLQVGERAIAIITPQGNLLSLDQWDGSLDYYIQGYRVYESTDCTGTGYWDHHFRSASPKFVPIRPAKIALFPATPFTKEIEVRSDDYSGCGTYAEPVSRTVLNPDQYIIDPAEYGFEWVEDGDFSYWRFPVPLSIEIVKSDVIFCSGFESCPVATE